MNGLLQIQPKPSKVVLSSTPIRVGSLQRKCACGGTPGPSGECEDCAKKKLQRKAAFPQPANQAHTSVPPVVHEVLRSPGQPLDTASRAFMEPRFGHDFGQVRVHTNERAAESARAVNAMAYTVGKDIVFGAGTFGSQYVNSRKLLAHELTHVLQQGGAGAGSATGLKINDPDDTFEHEADRAAERVMSPHVDARVPVENAGTLSQPSVQRDTPAAPMDDPSRFQKVHDTLFPPPAAATGPAAATPAGGNPPAFDAAAQASVKKQLTDAIKDLESKNPGIFLPDLPNNTNQNNAETAALAMDQQISAHYPQITAPSSKAAFLSHIHVMTDAMTDADNYLKQSLTERLRVTDIEKYQLQETDPQYQDFLTDLLTDSYLKSRIRELGRHKGAFTATDTKTGVSDLFLNQAISGDKRDQILLHELVHFYTHPSFRAWVESTVDPRLYSEGISEYLARKAMTADQLKNNGTPYQDRVTAVERDVVKFVPDDDLARACFGGEVWLIEGKSQVAKKTFKEQTGLDPDVSRAAEKKQSRDTEGIVETVAPGERYRFMNLGNEVAEPKPNHLDFFKHIFQNFVQNDPTARLRFVGHASSPGTASFNDALSLQRARAFYQMARDTGVPEAQLLNAKTPDHFGKSQPTAGEDDVRSRAFNRRVELFITHDATPSGTASQMNATPASDLKNNSPSGDVLQRKAWGGNSPAAAPPIVHEVLRSPGQPLDPTTRAFFEPRFGHDFSAVRVHTDNRAAESAQSVNAQAYTVGRDVVFSPAQYAPATPAGRWLLGHELAHVVQQDQSSFSTAGLQVSAANHPAEAQADRAADSVTAGTSVPSLATRVGRAPVLSRKVVARNVNCSTGINGASLDPVADLTAAESHAQGLVQAAAILTAVEWSRMTTGATDQPSDTRLAYEEFFGLPPAVKGGFMNRLTGKVTPKQDDAILGELDLLGNRLQLIANNFDQNIHYGCIGGAETFMGCTGDCDDKDAYACPDIPAILICPTFWSPSLTENGRATLFIHEAAHMLWARVIHFSNYRHASCYANYVARLFNAPPTGPACPTPAHP